MLEDERSEARKLRSELGQLRSQLDIAQTTGGELAAAASELDRVRTQARESDRQLQATVRALDQQRAESERLRMRLTAGEATIERLTRAHQTSERTERAERSERSEREATTRRPSAEASGVESRVHESIGSAAPVAGAPSSYPPLEAEPLAPRTDTHYARPVRPLNPALRSRPNWTLRVMTLVVILGVIAAIVLVIHSTMP